MKLGDTRGDFNRLLTFFFFTFGTEQVLFFRLVSRSLDCVRTYDLLARLLFLTSYYYVLKLYFPERNQREAKILSSDSNYSTVSNEYENRELLINPESGGRGIRVRSLFAGNQTEQVVAG